MPPTELKRRFNRACFICTMVLWSSVARADPPTLSHVFPAGLQRGQEVVLTAAGKLDPWPVKAWSESPGLTVEPLEKKGQLRLKSDTDLPCGVHWFRVYNGEGASALQPIVAGTLAEIAEQEPNETLQQAKPIDLPVTINARLGKTGDVDVYQVRLREDDQLVVSFAGNFRLGTPVDGVIQIVDEGGFVLDQNDDSRGLDPLITFRAPRGGHYFIRVFGFPATPNQSIRFGGGDAFIYRLTVTTGGYLDHALPMVSSSNEADHSTSVRPFGWNLPSEGFQTVPGIGGLIHVFHPNVAAALELPVEACPHVMAGSVDAPKRIELPSVISGRIYQKDQVDLVEFQTTKDEPIEVRIEADSLGSLLDPQLTLFDADGGVLAEADDAGRNNRDCELTYTPKVDGPVRLHIRDAFFHGGLRYYYRAYVERAQPDYRLTVNKDSFVKEAAADKALEITVQVQRIQGFKGSVEVNAVGLPESVRIETATSKPEGDTAKSVTLKVAGSHAAFSGRFRIQGSTGGEQGRQHEAVFERNLPRRSVTEFWMTIR